MRKSALLLMIALLLVAGCNGEAANPGSAPSPTSPPAPTPETPTVASPSGSATCVVAPFELPVNPNIPPVSEVDHIHGPDDAPITFIEYADFQ